MVPRAPVSRRASSAIICSTASGSSRRVMACCTAKRVCISSARRRVSAYSRAFSSETAAALTMPQARSTSSGVNSRGSSKVLTMAMATTLSFTTNGTARQERRPRARAVSLLVRGSDSAS